jgi:hypothetical protein
MCPTLFVTPAKAGVQHADNALDASVVVPRRGHRGFRLAPE